MLYRAVGVNFAQRVACKFSDGKYYASSPRESWGTVGYGRREFPRRAREDGKTGEEKKNRWSAYHLSKRARRRTLAYFLVIHSVACLDNASAGRQRYFMVSHLLACPGFFLSVPISPRLHLRLRSPPTCAPTLLQHRRSVTRYADFTVITCFLSQT